MTLRIGVLTSTDAPGLDELLHDAGRGTAWDVACVVAAGTRAWGGNELLQSGVPLIEHSLVRYQRGLALSVRNLREREAYDASIVELLGDVDYVFLDDYRYIVTGPLLEAFGGKIVAFHDGDLSVGPAGSRSLTGLHAVREALLAGHLETRSSAFIATERAGNGPLFLLGEAYPVSGLLAAALGRTDLADFAMYAALHRRWMVHSSYGRLMRKAAELLAVGSVQVIHDTVWVDGAPGPCRLGNAPAVCRADSAPAPRGIPASCPLISEGHS